MKREEPTVVAVCTTAEEVLELVNRLTNEGYSKKDIMVYANKGTTDPFENKEQVRIEKDDDQGVMDKVKGMFQSDQKDAVDYLEPYREDIRNGKFVVSVEGYRGEIGYMPEQEAAEPVLTDSVPQAQTDLVEKDDTIRLKEEQLDIDKHEVTTGDVEVTKNVVKEVRTIEVPVEREELVIEKRSFKDGEDDSETIRIPVKEEEIEVTKKPVIKEEVSVRKEVTEEMQQVSGEVKKERLDVDTQGDVRISEADSENGPPKAR